MTARVGATFREGFAIARSQRLATGVCILIVAAVCTIVLGTLGRSSAATRRVLDTIDQAGTRQVIVSDVDGSAQLDASAIGRVENLLGTEWAVGLGAVVDGANSVFGANGIAVGSRQVFGDIPGSMVLRRLGRLPGPGEAVAGAGAGRTLGMRDGVGSFARSDGRVIPIVGEVELAAPLDSLNDLVLVATDRDVGQVRTLFAVAEKTYDVAGLGKAIGAVLNPVASRSLRIDTSEELARVRSVVGGELNRSNRSLTLIVLGVGLLLNGLNTFGFVAVRRRDFGRRRALGASRSLVVVLLIIQSASAAVIGVVLGLSVGMAVVLRWEGLLPGIGFIVGVALLTVLSTVIAVIPPALFAAFRDPVRVLRVA